MGEITEQRLGNPRALFAESDQGQPGVVLAVDGGGSKTDVVALSLEGELLAWVRGPGSSTDHGRAAQSLGVIRPLVEEALRLAGSRPTVQTSIYLSGIDLQVDADVFAAAIEDEEWVRGSLVPTPVIENDLFALLRAGTSEPNAVAVVCGTGINAVAVRRDGASARFPALGVISGDFGGGAWLGHQALWHAARSDDGRGPKTVLEQRVSAALGVASVPEAIEGIHFHRIPIGRVNQLAPIMFEVADAGDELARRDIDALALEIVTMVVTLLRRLELTDPGIPIVLGGSVLAASHPILMDAIRHHFSELGMTPSLRLVEEPPILGASMLALEAAGGTTSVLNRAQEEIRARARSIRSLGTGGK